MKKSILCSNGKTISYEYTISTTTSEIDGFEPMTKAEINEFEELAISVQNKIRIQGNFKSLFSPIRQYCQPGYYRDDSIAQISYQHPEYVYIAKVDRRCICPFTEAQYNEVVDLVNDVKESEILANKELAIALLEKEQKEIKVQIANSENTISRAEKQGELPTQAEYKKWRKHYNDMMNEGGYGYIPEKITKEMYDDAIVNLTELKEKEITISNKIESLDDKKPDITAVVYVENGVVTATLGEIMESQGINIEEALDILGLDGDKLDKFFSDLGWDGYDYNCIEFA